MDRNNPSWVSWEHLSGESSDWLIDHGHSVWTILEIDTCPLVVHVMHVVDVSVDDWGHHVDKEEHWDGWEDQSHEIAWQTLVDHAVSLEGAKGVPQSLVIGSGGEGGLLLAEAWNIQVDASAQLSLDFEPFDHGDNLSLFLVSLRVVGANLPQVLVDVVLHFFYWNYILIIKKFWIINKKEKEKNKTLRIFD